MVVAGITITASFLIKIGKMQSAGCRLCRIAREAHSESTDGLAVETHGHIDIAGCGGMATTVTAAHHSIWRHLYDSMRAAHKPKSKLKFVMLDKESKMSTLWRRDECLRICSEEDRRKGIIRVLRAAALKWEFEHIDFVVVNCGSVVKSDFYTKLKKLDVQEGKKDKLFANHVTQVCEAHDRVIVFFLQQVQGFARPTTEGSRENIGHNVHV